MLSFSIMDFRPRTLFFIASFMCLSQLGACATVADRDIQDFSEKLLSKDVNNAAKYVTINFQSKKRQNVEDSAPRPLLSVNKKAYDLPSISKLVKIYDNYVPDVAIPETETKEELDEEHAFIDEVSKTPVMQEMKAWLQQNSLLPKNMDNAAFNKWLFDFWFTMYSRGRRIVGSSAFEHVFLGEIKNKEVSGFHSWIFFADQENKTTADYLGWKKYQNLQDKGTVMKLSYKWSGIPKFTGSMFVGTSPELEMALYTTCFLTRPNTQCKLQLNGTPVTLQTYSFSYRGKNYIGSAYPDI
nr:PREDICTED: poly(U)-specific endoribonuclease homolog [Bemisia tabaci]